MTMIPWCRNFKLIFDKFKFALNEKVNEFQIYFLILQFSLFCRIFIDGFL